MKVLFIHQEITPYLKETPMSLIGRYLPQGIQERGKEIRIFMPRFGNINELHNQLHEVIRLSGMNMIINDTDHPLIIKVASIQKARIQIYFIDDNDELFAKRKFTTVDKNKVFFEDNDDRTMFFSRGVIETVRKLNWPPDIIHCHGWMSLLCRRGSDALDFRRRGRRFAQRFPRRVQMRRRSRGASGAAF